MIAKRLVNSCDKAATEQAESVLLVSNFDFVLANGAF